MNWTKPKPCIKRGFKKITLMQKMQQSCLIGTVYAATDYKTGKTIYYILEANAISTTFSTFEQLMIYADLNSIALDTADWETYGIIRCYTTASIGDVLKFSDGHSEVLHGLDDQLVST